MCLAPVSPLPLVVAPLLCSGVPVSALLFTVVVMVFVVSLFSSGKFGNSMMGCSGKFILGLFTSTYFGGSIGFKGVSLSTGGSLCGALMMRPVCKANPNTMMCKAMVTLIDDKLLRGG